MEVRSSTLSGMKAAAGADWFSHQARLFDAPLDPPDPLIPLRDALLSWAVKWFGQGWGSPPDWLLDVALNTVMRAYFVWKRRGEHYLKVCPQLEPPDGEGDFIPKRRSLTGNIPYPAGFRPWDWLAGESRADFLKDLRNAVRRNIMLLEKLPDLGQRPEARKAIQQWDDGGSWLWVVGGGAERMRQKGSPYEPSGKYAAWGAFCQAVGEMEETIIRRVLADGEAHCDAVERRATKGGAYQPQPDRPSAWFHLCWFVRHKVKQPSESLSSIACDPYKGFPLNQLQKAKVRWIGPPMTTIPGGLPEWTHGTILTLKEEHAEGFVSEGLAEWVERADPKKTPEVTPQAAWQGIREAAELISWRL